MRLNKAAAASATAAAAATAADAPSVAGSQELSPHAPEEPALHSSAAQHAVGEAGAQHANASSTQVDRQAAAPGSPKQAAEELPAGEEAEGGEETEGGVEGRLERSSEEQAGKSVVPQEPALQSGLGQRAASNEHGELPPGPMYQKCCSGSHP